MATYQSTHTGAEIDTAVDAVSGKAEKSEMSVVAGTGADADKTTITLKSGTSATVLTTHQDISGKADTSALAGYLPLTGGTLSGALTVSADVTTTGHIYLNNGYWIKGKDSNGTYISLVSISSANNLSIGYGLPSVGDVNIYGTNIKFRVNGTGSSDQAVLIDSSKNTTFTGYIKAVGDIYMGPETATTNTDSKKLYFRTSHFGDTTNNVGPYVQAITHSSTYGRKRLSVFQVNAASYTGTYSEVFTILPNGNVGIGTTSPTTALGVTGDVAISGGLSLGGQAVVKVFSGSSAPSSSTGSDGDIYIQTS